MQTHKKIKERQKNLHTKNNNADGSSREQFHLKPLWWKTTNPRGTYINTRIIRQRDQIILIYCCFLSKKKKKKESGGELPAWPTVSHWANHWLLPLIIITLITQHSIWCLSTLPSRATHQFQTPQCKGTSAVKMSIFLHLFTTCTMAMLTHQHCCSPTWNWCVILNTVNPKGMAAELL